VKYETTDVVPTTRQTPLPFHAARERMSRFIRNGGLALPKEWSQVHASSFPFLADINAGGMLTGDSQDAIDSVPIERAYVEGYMLPGHARAYIKWINMNTDKVALIVSVFYSDDTTVRHCLKDFEYAPGITVTRARGDGGEWRAVSSIVPAIKATWKSMKDEMREWYGMRPRRDVVLVETFDPVWGRSAVTRDGLFPAAVTALRSSMPA
jgi:hypothetical protein